MLGRFEALGAAVALALARLVGEALARLEGEVLARLVGRVLGEALAGLVGEAVAEALAVGLGPGPCAPQPRLSSLALAGAQLRAIMVAPVASLRTKGAL